MPSADLLAYNGSHSKSFACVPMGEVEGGNGDAIHTSMYCGWHNLAIHIIQDMYR